jgi:hypothetical protein
VTTRPRRTVDHLRYDCRGSRPASIAGPDGRMQSYERRRRRGVERRGRMPPLLRSRKLPGRRQLLLHAGIEARDVDHDALVGAAADRLALVVRLDGEGESTAFDRDKFGSRRHPHADRRRCKVAHVEMDAEALMALRQEMPQAASAAASITLIITGVPSTGTRPLPMLGAVWATPTTRSAEPLSPTFSRDRSVKVRSSKCAK